MKTFVIVLCGLVLAGCGTTRYYTHEKTSEPVLMAGMKYDWEHFQKADNLEDKTRYGIDFFCCIVPDTILAFFEYPRKWEHER